MPVSDKKEYTKKELGLIRLASVLLCAAALLVFAFTLLRQEENPESESSAEASGGTAEAALPSDTIAAVSTAEMPERFEIPREDPQAEGFFYDEGLTEELYGFFAGENTNNTDESSPYRSLSAKHKDILDRLAFSWLYGKLSDEEAREAMEAESFFWPDDPEKLPRQLQKSHVSLYRFPADARESAAERIRLGNTAARHYLFLLAYTAKEDGALRIYMINGMIW